jgi:nicotinamide-nucleotide adenylyltransferase
MTTALYIGRFQPFHNGHLAYIKQILEENDNLTIIIGSFDKHDSINPYTIEQRREMLKKCFEKENLYSRIKIIAIKDFPGDNDKWLAHVLDKVDKFDVYYAGENEVTRQIFLDAGFKVKIHERINNISGTQIRERMKQGKEWKHLVPGCVYEYIKKT